MSTDYQMVCYTCKKSGPTFASGSIAYGYKVWDIEDVKKWLGHRESCGHHEGHDLRIQQSCAIEWDDEAEGGEGK